MGYISTCGGSDSLGALLGHSCLLERLTLVSPTCELKKMDIMKMDSLESNKAVVKQSKNLDKKELFYLMACSFLSH